MRVRAGDSFWIAALLGSGYGAAHAQLEPTASDVVECVAVDHEARYRGLGYDHLVYLRNLCEHAVRCEVSSNVRTDAEHVEIAAGEATTVLTFRGSPASTFEPNVRCERAL